MKLDREDILDIIHISIDELHGFITTDENTLVTELRLQNYAIIVLFFNLNKKFELFNTYFDIEYISNAILTPYKLSDIIDAVMACGVSNIHKYKKLQYLHY